MEKYVKKYLLPLFSVAVALVFAVVFTLLLIPVTLSPLSNPEVDGIFLSVLVFTAVVASTVAIVFYRIFAGEIK